MSEMNWCCIAGNSVTPADCFVGSYYFKFVEMKDKAKFAHCKVVYDMFEATFNKFPKVKAAVLNLKNSDSFCKYLETRMVSAF